MYHYHIEIGFDDRSEPTSDELSSFTNKYNAVSIGHDRTGTTSLFFQTEENLTKKRLEKLLDYTIIRIKKSRLKNTG